MCGKHVLKISMLYFQLESIRKGTSKRRVTGQLCSIIIVAFVDLRMFS